VSIETFTFRLTQKSIMMLPDCRQSDLRYVIVKETKEHRHYPGVRVAYPEDFTHDEKIRLEKLSRDVNTERQLKGIL
jgi:hypothetical protein